MAALVQNPKKLEEKGIFIGFHRGSPAYLVYFPETNSVGKSKNCKIFEDSNARGSN